MLKKYKIVRDRTSPDSTQTRLFYIKLQNIVFNKHKHSNQSSTSIFNNDKKKYKIMVQYIPLVQQWCGGGFYKVIISKRQMQRNKQLQNNENQRNSS